MREDGHTHLAVARLRRTLGRCLLALALLGLAACSGAGAADEEFRIGLLAPVTGTAQAYTGHLWAERLVAQVNAQGGLDVGGRKLKVRLLVEDTGGQVERTLSTAVRLIRQERVAALVGPYYSRGAIPVANATEAAQVPMVSPTASNPQVTLGRKYAFRVCLVDTVQGRFMARYAFHVLGLRSVAVLYDESDTYPKGLARCFAEAFAALGGKVVAQEGYPGGAADFSTQLGRIRAAKAQALYLPNYAQDVVLQMVQARAAGFGGVFLGGDSWEEGTSVLESPAAQGSFFTANFAHGLMGEAARRQAERLEAVAGVPLDSDGAMMLDALGVVLAAAQAVGSVDPVSLRAGIASLRGYEGFSGRLSFEQGGDAQRSAHILGIEGGQARSRKELGPGQ